MKITRKQLKQLISESIVLAETQVALGLPHMFNNYDLAKRIFAAVAANEDESILMKLRDVALNRIKLTRRDIGKGIDVDNKNHEDLFLQQAVDHIDTSRGDYDTHKTASGSPENMSRLGVPSDGPYAGHGLNRRIQQDKKRMQADYHRARAKEI